MFGLREFKVKGFVVRVQAFRMLRYQQRRRFRASSLRFRV